ncbi:GL12893 [Drosophila persimilis]|uniref:GL12893 n=1 Tax=Drosophila persimilis TaxID=7234 RepID=B4GV73_DROPE|nr:uncharacterized protein LOC6597288 [Drosophila persimilis]EDW26610.1 GL12893 [Drosophila persimilis]
MPNNSRVQYFPGGLNIRTCERYPHQRQTEFYRTPEPRPSAQGQKAEHDAERLNRPPGPEAPVRGPRIQPARTSETRAFRNAYFS